MLKRRPSEQVKRAGPRDIDLLTRELTVHVSEKVGHVAALLLRPHHARWLLVLAHGAGAGMHHAFMESLAHELADSQMATLRYQFPYMQQRRGRPDPPGGAHGPPCAPPSRQRPKPHRICRCWQGANRLAGA